MRVVRKVSVCVSLILPSNSSLSHTQNTHRPDALRGSLGETLKQVRPTYFFGVPRVWEKMEEKMKLIGAKTEGLKKHIAAWARTQGLNGFLNLQVRL